MYSTVGKWGDSLGLRIPRRIAKAANMEEGMTFELRVEDGRIIVSPIQTESLDGLINRLTETQRRQDRRVGRFVLIDGE